MEEDVLARLFGTGLEGGGTKLSDIKTPLEDLGMWDVFVGPGTYQDLEQAIAEGYPVIVPVESGHLGTYAQGEGGGHSVVLTAIDPNRVEIYDPQKDDGPDRILLPRFQMAWQVKRCRMAVIKPK